MRKRSAQFYEKSPGKFASERQSVELLDKRKVLDT